MESTTLIQAPSETDVTSTPIKKRQCSLFETFSGEKRPRMTETTETLQMSSHRKLRSSLSGASLVAFEVELKKVRKLEALVEKQRALKRELRESSTQLVDPTKRAPSMTLGNKVIGRPKGSMLSNKDKSHKRSFAGPVLRRDPTAPEKLAMIMFCERLCKEQIVEDIKLLRGQDRKSFEKKYHHPFFNVINWAGKKAMLSEFVGKSRIGKHGLRPCGLNGKSVFATSSGGLSENFES